MTRMGTRSLWSTCCWAGGGYSSPPTSYGMGGGGGGNCSSSIAEKKNKLQSETLQNFSFCFVQSSILKSNVYDNFTKIYQISHKLLGVVYS